MSVPKLRFKEFIDEWKEYTLQNESDVRDGTHDSPKYIEHGYPLITSKNLTDMGTLDFSNVNYLKQEDFDKINERSKVDVGDILFGMIGTIGKPVRINRDDFAIKNVALIKEKGLIKNDYLIHYLQTSAINKQFANNQDGGTQKFIALEKIRKLKIKMPSRKEQKKLVLLFDLLDKKIELQAKKIEALKLFKKGLLKKIFSSVNNYKAFKNIATLKNGYTFKNNLYSKSGKYNIVTISNVTGNKYIDTNFKNKYEILPTDLQSHQLLKNNDILVSMTGNVGRVSLNRGYNNLLNQRVGLIVPSDDIDPFYLFYVLSDTHFEKSMINLAQGAAQANISKEDIDNYPVPILSKEKQKKIAKILNIYFKFLFLEQEKLNKLKILKKGLMQNMFV